MSGRSILIICKRAGGIPLTRHSHTDAGEIEGSNILDTALGPPRKSINLEADVIFMTLILGLPKINVN